MRVPWSRVALAVACVGLVTTSWLGLQLVLADPDHTGGATGSPGDASGTPAGQRVPLGPNVNARTGTDGDTCQPGSYREAVAAKEDFAEEHLHGGSDLSDFGVTGVGVSQRTDEPVPSVSFVVSVIAARSADTADRPSCSAGVQVVWMTGGPFYGA